MTLNYTLSIKFRAAFFDLYKRDWQGSLHITDVPLPKQIIAVNRDERGVKLKITLDP